MHGRMCLFLNVIDALQDESLSECDGALRRFTLSLLQRPSVNLRRAPCTSLLAQAMEAGELTDREHPPKCCDVCSCKRSGGLARVLKPLPSAMTPRQACELKRWWRKTGEWRWRMNADGEILFPHPERCMCECHLRRSREQVKLKRRHGQRGQDKKPRKKKGAGPVQGQRAGDGEGGEGDWMSGEQARETLREWAEKEGIGPGAGEEGLWDAWCTPKMIDGPAYYMMAIRAGVKDVETRGSGKFGGLMVLRENKDDTGESPMVNACWMPAFELAMRFDPARCTQMELRHPGQVACVAWFRRLSANEAADRVWAHPVAGQENVNAYEVSKVACLTPSLIPVSSYVRKEADIGLTEAQYVYLVHQLVGKEVPAGLSGERSCQPTRRRV